MSKPVLNYSENTVYSAIGGLCSQYQVQIHPKMRVADVFTICKHDVRRSLWYYYLNSHFDLVLSFGNNTILAIEFDGPCHQTSEASERDAKKTLLASIAWFPIFRVRPFDIEPNVAPLLGRLKVRLDRFATHKATLAQSGCPLCSSPLVQRSGLYGVFWGCSHWPDCEGKRNVKDLVLCLR